MNFYRTHTKRLRFLIAAVVLTAINLSWLSQAHAGTYMSQVSVAEFNMGASQSSGFAISFKPGAADTSNLVIGFGTWGGTVNTTQTITTTGCSSLFPSDTALPSATSLAAAGSGSNITISNITSPLTAGTAYCAILSSATAVTNPATTNVSYPVTFTDGTDSSTAAIYIFASNQVLVSATVPPSFTMGLSSTTDSLGSLSATALTTSTGVQTSISTNATNGWFLWAEDSNAGLHSTTASKYIASVTPNSNTTMLGAGKVGSEAYALGVTSANATTAYADAGGSTGAGLSSSAYNEIASGNAAVSGAQVNTKELADISATTPAASDYSDTISLVGAGSF